MSKKFLAQDEFAGGISESSTSGLKDCFFFSQNLDIFTDPSQLTLNPKTVKVSGTTVVDLVKWIVSGTPYDTNTYSYGDTGKFYSMSSSNTWSVLRTVSNSVGQGMELSSDYIYYTQNTQIGRYGPLSSGPNFTDNWQTGLNNTSSTGFAPVKEFANGLAVGHGNNLAWWDGSVWTLARLTFPAGFNIRSLDIVDEFLVITAWRGTTITASEQAYLFFWDGTATTFNYFVKSDEGAVNATVNTRNRLFSVIGSSGAMFINYSPLEKVHQLPKLEFAKYVEVFPGAITNWKNIVHVGFAGNTDSSNIVEGVYQYGSKSTKYDEVLNMGYTISEGVTTGISIGSLKGIGNQMFIGWKHGSTYGVDLVTQTNSPFALGTIEFLIFDNGSSTIEKLADILKAGHYGLNSGEGIQLAYKTDRASSYTFGTANTTSGDKTTILPIAATYTRFHEFQFAIILVAAGSTSPTVTGVSFKFDDLLPEVSSGRK